MKAAKRSILICVLTLILSVSLLAGVTFAWFTDSITNSGNTIQSGELAIDATAYDRVDTEAGGLTVTIDGENVASGTYYFEAEGASLRNGDPVITEENWQPGDMNAKLFTVSNEGSIDAVVSLDFFVSGDLAQYLWYDFIAVDPANETILGEFSQRNDLTTLQTLAADREFTLSPAADLEDGEVSQVTFLFVYGLPTSATNEAMNKAVNVNVVVSAKQNVEGAEGPVVVNPGTDLSETLAEVPDNSTIVLSEGNYIVDDSLDLSGKEGIVIDGNGATLTTSDAISGISTLANNGGNIIEIAGASNVTIRNLTISGAEHHGINIWESTDVVVENVTIENSGAAAITINASEVTLNNVTTSGSAWGGVNVDDGDEESTIKTVFTVDENCAFGEYLQIYADDATIADNVTVNAEGYNKYTVTAHDGNTRILWTNDSAVTEGCAFVNTSLRLKNAILANSDIILLNDVDGRIDMFKADYVPGYDRTTESADSFFTMNYSGTINLNGYTLDLAVAYTRPLFIGQNFSSGNYGAVNNVTIKNGTLIAAGLVVVDGATLTVENVEYNSTLTSFLVLSKNSTLNVTDSTVISKYAYVIGTNASAEGEDGTGTHGVIINVTGSTLKSDYIDADSGSVTVFFNVPGNLNIEDSTIYGVQNAVMVRGGTAVISGSTLTTAEQIAAGSEDKFTNENWKDGNNVPYAALLVGNRSSNAYQYATSVMVKNTTITSNNAEVPAIYIWGNATEEIGAYLELDQDTYGKMTGGIAGDTSSEHGSVKMELPEGIELVDTAAELESAVVKGGHYVLAYGEYTVTNGLTLNNVTTTLDIPQGVNIVLTDNGIFDLEEGSELIINSDGTIENDVDETDGSITKLGYIFRLEDNSKLTLLSGNYYAGLTIVQAAGTSEAKIYSGNYDVYQYYSNGSQYVLNYIDADKETAKIIVYGGSFVNFDPSHSTSENPAANFVAEGYEVIKTTGENETPIYTVVPEAQQ